MNLRVALCVVALCSCKSKPTLDGPCDSTEMAGLRGVLSTVEPDNRATITTIGLGEACQGKLPSEIADGIETLSSANPEDRATLIASFLYEELSFAKRGCPDWEKTAAGIAATEVSKRPAYVYSVCKYERFDLLTVAEFERSWKASGYALLAVPMYAWLVEKNMEPAEAKRLARSMFLDEKLPEPK